MLSAPEAGASRRRPAGRPVLPKAIEWAMDPVSRLLHRYHMPLRKMPIPSMPSPFQSPTTGMSLRRWPSRSATDANGGGVLTIAVAQVPVATGAEAPRGVEAVAVPVAGHRDVAVATPQAGLT